MLRAGLGVRVGMVLVGRQRLAEVAGGLWVVTAALPSCRAAGRDVSRELWLALRPSLPRREDAATRGGGDGRACSMGST